MPIPRMPIPRMPIPRMPIPTRFAIAALCLLSALGYLAACDDVGEPGPTLRLNHLQVRGTHNSYHLIPPNDVPDWQYAHRPLAEQLSEQGVRQFELDVHYDRVIEGFRVFHVPGVDTETHCDRLEDCLGELEAWSSAHPGHHAIFVFLEPKDEFDPDKIAPHFDDLEAAILSVWPRERLVIPDDVRGERATLRDAVLEDGWPTVDATRGKAVFVMLDGEHNRDAYVAPDPSLAGRLILPYGQPDDPWAGVMSRDDAERDRDELRALVEAGFIVCTRGETPQAREIAIAYGAHIISGDFPDDIAIPGGVPTGCNPVSAPPDCQPEAIESL